MWAYCYHSKPRSLPHKYQRKLHALAERGAEQLRWEREPQRSTTTPRAGIFVLFASSLPLDEDGGTGTFTVNLHTKLNGSATMLCRKLRRYRQCHRLAGVPDLSGHLCDWSIAQTVTVTGVDDCEVNFSNRMRNGQPDPEQHRHEVQRAAGLDGDSHAQRGLSFIGQSRGSSRAGSGGRHADPR